MKKIVFFLFIGYAFASCKEEEKPLPEKAVWEEISHFKGRDKILLNSMGTEDVLYLYGIGRITRVTDPQNSGEFSFENTAGFGHTDLLYKPLMHPDFILIDATEWRISLKTLYPNTWSISTISNFHFSPPDTTTGTFNLAKSKYWDGAFIAANDNKQLLIPIEQGKQCLLATLDMRFNHISDVELKKIELPNNLSYFNGSKDYFIAAAPGNTYRIDSAGNFSQVSNYGIKQFVAYNPDTSNRKSEILVGITWGGRLATSFDHGSTWNIGADRFDIDLFQLVNLDGNILGYNERYGLIQFLIGEDEIIIKRIDTEGLADGITSLTKFKDYFVVSTFSGAFRKHQDDFFTYRD